jgi:hypothetical protein
VTFFCSISEFHQLRDKGPKSYAQQGRKIDRMRIVAEVSLDQHSRMPDALRHRNREFSASG